MGLLVVMDNPETILPWVRILVRDDLVTLYLDVPFDLGFLVAYDIRTCGNGHGRDSLNDYYSADSRGVGLSKPCTVTSMYYTARPSS